MSKAVWNGVVLAESDETIVLEGNHYFPVETLNTEFFTDSTKRSTCPWKGVALYYTVRAGDDELPHAAWYYPHPSPAAEAIRDRVAFDSRVQVREAPAD